VSKHTPGPWVIVREELGEDFTDEEQAKAWPLQIGPIAMLDHEAESDEIERIEADALLIAAAPDLYAVAEKLLGAFKKGIRSLEDFEEEELYDAASAAFRKAGGQ